MASPLLVDQYRVRLPIFEGPLDLLIFFIKRDEIDIYDIPIAKITQDFLDYLNLMTALNLVLAGDFMVIAATLMRIKARMLLPPTPGEEDEDFDFDWEWIGRNGYHSPFSYAARGAPIAD